MKDYKYIAKVGSKYLTHKGTLTKSKVNACEFESDEEPKQIFNQMKRDGKLDKGSKLKTTKIKEDLRSESEFIKELIDDGVIVDEGMLLDWMEEHPKQFSETLRLLRKYPDKIMDNFKHVFDDYYSNYHTEDEEYGAGEVIYKMEEPINEASLTQTRRYAKARHDRTGAVRKHSGQPYFVHPDSVANLVKYYGGDDDQIQAAYLHDTMEDTGETQEHLAELFGERVANIVAEITNDPYEVRSVGKEQYISNELCNLSHDALLVKLCDILYNQMDYPKDSQASRQLNNIDYLLANRGDDLTDNEISVIEAFISTCERCFY